jgi:hypothetical protein
MTEAEWLACADPDKMLPTVPVKPRKLRLFALACCARVDDLITDPRSQAALEFAEQHVETPVNRQKGRTAIFNAADAVGEELFDERLKYKDRRSSAVLACSAAAQAAANTMLPDPKEAAHFSASLASIAAGWRALYVARRRGPGRLPREMKAPEVAQQALLFRDICGNPFRPVKTDPSWLTSDVVSLARGIYEEKAFDRMPILADALQDAGCANEDVLNHCRAETVHVRGCWAIDLLLGKS